MVINALYFVTYSNKSTMKKTHQKYNISCYNVVGMFS